MKKLLALFFAVLLVGLSLGITAAAEPVTELKDIASGAVGHIEWSINSDYCLTLRGSGPVPDFEEEATGAWFDYKSSVLSLSVEEGVTALGSYALCGFDRLASATLPESFKELSGGAFAGCRSLVDISVNGLNPHFSSKEGALYDKVGTTLVYCPQGLLGLEYTVNKDVTAIGPYAFAYAGGINKIHLPSGLVTIGDRAFYKCTFITEINIPQRVKLIGAGAFENCVRLYTVHLPKKLLSLGDKVFKNCGELRAVTVPEGVKTIGVEAFYACRSLKEIGLPLSVEEIDENAFCHCTSLKTVSYSGSSWQYGLIDKAKGNEVLKNAKINTAPGVMLWVVIGAVTAAFAAVLVLAVKRDKKQPA